MKPEDRFVTCLPLSELWNDSGVVPAARSSWLVRRGVQLELQGGLLQFVVANVGHPLRWVPHAAAFEAWKKDYRQHIVDPSGSFDASSFSDGYAYVASLWIGPSGERFVVLECHH